MTARQASDEVLALVENEWVQQKAEHLHRMLSGMNGLAYEGNVDKTTWDLAIAIAVLRENPDQQVAQGAGFVVTRATGAVSEFLNVHVTGFMIHATEIDMRLEMGRRKAAEER